MCKTRMTASWADGPQHGKAASGARFYVLDDKGHGFAIMQKGGEPWGDQYYTAAVAFGDVDGDNRDEIGVARHAGENRRWFIRDDNQDRYRDLTPSDDIKLSFDCNVFSNRFDLTLQFFNLIRKEEYTNSYISFIINFY